MHTTLYTLFMPPQDCFGDFGLFCGFTATPQVLRQIRRNFSGEMARPALAAFIHPTVNAVSDIPGLAWMWMRKSGYNLLHAKVALLGFRKRGEDGYVIRLAVSTGNWTQDPLTDSIDLFWSVDVDCADPQPQDVADLRAAWAMFDWLRERGDCRLIEREYDGALPDARLRAAVSNLPATELSPRFIDSRTQALNNQVLDRIGLRQKADSLILGSGYFEADGEDGGVPERLRNALIERQALKVKASLDLFLNPLSCQGLVTRAAALDAAGWNLRQAFSQIHGHDARLHAKFVLLARGDTQISGRVYLGSGNLSRAGFEMAANAGGNLEAGVVVDLPEGLDWSSKKGIRTLLPIQFDEDVTPTDLKSGEDFTRPEEPEALPKVSWLIWHQGMLSAPDNQTVAVTGPDGTQLKTPCPLPAPAPAIVTLTEGGWRLPVIAEGVLVTPPPPEMTVEDVLAGLGSFPEPPDRDLPEDGPEGGEAQAEAADAPGAAPATYAIRRMMNLVVRLGETQRMIDPRDWQRWCRELRQNLCAVTAQEQGMIEFFRNAGANPLPVLADPRLCPDGIDPALLNEALATVAAVWGLNEYPSLWIEEAA